MKRIFGWLSSFLIAGACDTSTVPTYEPQPDEAVTSIAHLKTRCTGHSLTLTQDIRLHCVVTANDHYGEFDHELVVADPSGGIEIEVDATELYRICPLDTEFTLYCNGLALGNYGGKILLGVPSGGTYVVDRIPESELGRYLRRDDTGELRREYTLHTFSEISMRDVDTYVRFDNVRFTATGNWCDVDSLTGKPVTTERLIADPEGATFSVRTLGSAHYANEPLPVGRGSLCGIIDYFNGKFSLRVTNREFVGFGDTRLNGGAPPRACPSDAECSAPSPTR